MQPRWFVFLFLACIVGLVGMLACAICYADTLHTDEAVKPAGAESMHGTPVQYFGVDSCGIKVFWLVFADGHIVRFDADHKPKDFDVLLRSIVQLPHDLVTIPCTAQL